MADPSSTLWASLLAWFTPTSLFFFLNLTILTLVLSHRFNNNKKPNQQQQQLQHDQLGLFDSSQLLVRTPSLLDRVRSIKFSNYKYQPDHVTEHPAQDNPTEIVRTPSLLTRLKSMEFSSIYKFNQPDREVKALRPTGSRDSNPKRDRLVHRSKSDRASGAPETRPEKVIKKSASEKSKLVGVEEKDNISVRPRRMEHTTSFGDDEGEGEREREGEGVDAKCDDFINRFKQQLKLQRLDSILRYKEMLKRIN